MLQKLRSRERIDLPVEGMGRRRPTLAILGGLAVLFVIVPLVLSLLSGATARNLAIGLGAGVGTLLLVLLVFGARGKPGWNR
jgi:hypothetical protein